ncbi:unnamed protein product [Echinostoma caproni]|uniref:CIA30 domain-containing protein n=1 Tax=Echinostoma caproni TaxID=27848 RepID=A0A183A5E8_9TREM|nr:unnamed protein product [Echinostoma caproni]
MRCFAVDAPGFLVITWPSFIGCVIDFNNHFGICSTIRCDICCFSSHTHIVHFYTLPRYRGDGRSYRINVLPQQDWDANWFNAHHFVLYTRGGPYWQIAKIPLSKFFILTRGLIRRDQYPVKGTHVRLLSFTVMDNCEGPFSLELDYIALYIDPDHHEKFAYEEYDRSGIVQ